MSDERLGTLEQKFSTENRQLDKKSYRVEEILNLINKDDIVLDIGCVAHSATVAQSDLWLHGRLEKKADKVVGIDYAKEEVEKLQESGYDVRHANAEDFQFDRNFDKIVAGELIEHLSNPGLFLESAKNHLNPDGSVILTTPNPWTVDRITGAVLVGGISPNPDHVCWYDKFTIETLLNKNGLEIEHFSFHKPPKPNSDLSYRYFRNKILGLTYDFGFEMLGGPEMIIKAGVK